MQHAEQHDRDGLAEIQRVRCLLQELTGIPQIAVQVGGGTEGAAGQQGAGMGEHYGIVIRVHDPRIRGNPLGYALAVWITREG